MAVQKKDIVLEYIIQREKDWNAKGIFRCNSKLDGNPECPFQCDKCRNYYTDKRDKNNL